MAGTSRTVDGSHSSAWGFLGLIMMVSGLVEAFHFAERNGLDLEPFVAVLDARTDG